MPTTEETAQGRKGFSFIDFVKELLTGAVTGGMAGAAFYGAGKAVEAVKESIKRAAYRNRNDSELILKLDLQFFAEKGNNDAITELTSYYPSNNGAVAGTENNIYLMAGDKIDRYGKLSGKYFSPAGTPLEMRALPYDADLTQYRQFEVIKPFEVESSIISPAFGKSGLGTQYRSSVSAEVLLKHGIIKYVGGK